MIIIGAYADRSGPFANFPTPLAGLSDHLNRIAPPTVGVHLMPLYPESGDDGYAVDDLFSVKHDVGTWDDVRSLAQRRPLILDGIYNHVGMNHRFVRQFYQDPTEGCDTIHAYALSDNTLGPQSPRGSSVLRSHIIEGKVWHFWQTFSHSAVDINLYSAHVIDEVERHLDLLQSLGTYAVRLDAVAYYAKQLGGKMRHNPGATQLASLMAGRIRRRGMRTIAQLDCDAPALDYFNDALDSDCARFDFSYAAYLAHAILTGSADRLVDHITETVSLGKEVIRSPRGHDGILFRSQYIDDQLIDEILVAARGTGLKVRIENNSPYELNCSGPWLYSVGRQPHDTAAAIELAIAFTSVLPGHCYLYLPFLLGIVPEDSPNNETSPDPRTLNRQHINPTDWARYFSGVSFSRNFEVMTLLTSGGIPTVAKQQLAVSIVCERGLVTVTDNVRRLRFIANFGHAPITLTQTQEKSPIWAHRFDGAALAALGYGIWADT